VIVASLSQTGITAPIVGDDQRPGATAPSTNLQSDLALRSARPPAERACIAPILSLVLRGSRLPMARLNSAGDKNLVVNASAFASCRPPTHVSSTSTCSFARHRYDLGAADHSGAEFVQDLKGCLVTREPELPLELDSGHSGVCVATR